MKSTIFLVGLSALPLLTSAIPIHPVAQGVNSTAVGLVRRTSRKTDSGLTVSNVPSDWPDDATLNRVLVTQPGKAFFWTGRNGGVSVEGKALLVAKAGGGNTLEGSLQAGGLIMPDFDFGNPETVRIWTVASKSFANLASGESFVVTGRSTREGNIFHKDELPRLKANRRITKVTKIDSTTARRTVVFDRNAGKADAAANEANLRRDACLASPPQLTIPRRSNSFRRDLSSSPLPANGTHALSARAAPPARAARRKAPAAPACPLPGAKQSKKVVARSNVSSKDPRERTFPKGGAKPKPRAPAPKRKVSRPANRPKRKVGTAAPKRKRVTPVKKPKKAAKPAVKKRGVARKRR